MNLCMNNITSFEILSTNESFEDEYMPFILRSDQSTIINTFTKHEIVDDLTITLWENRDLTNQLDVHAVT